ncbi:MAG: HAMP domain-containing histidine kinase [Gemmatirosa sp.]|nr:HAMP domain-containing histidine kinase [Gemmatirosa sp.]
MTEAPCRRTSIRLRLTAWYAAALLVAFSAAALGLRQAVGFALRDEYRTSLTHSAEFVQTFFGFEVSEYPSVEATAAHLVEELVFPAHEVELLRPDGTRVVPQHVRHREALDPTGAARSVRSVTLPLDSALAPGWRVRVSASTAPLDRPLARIDFWLGGAIAVGVVGAAAGGWWLAGRALRPIGDMAAATDRITAAGRGERLPVANPHDELGRLGTRVNALLDRLDAALAQQRQFLADAAHELRTPIARMRSRVDLARQPATASDAELRATIAAIDRDLARTTELVDELLQLARADAGVRRPALVPAFLDDVVMDALRAWHATVAQRGLRFEVEAMEEAPARLDATLVDRLVGVLLDNASRYTPPGGRVAVRVRRERVADDGEAAVLEVRDDGIGMSDEERVRACERFFRGARARALVPDGSGLGLPIAAWVADVHRATLTLAPNDGRGTVARVVFPAVGPTPPTSPTTSPS